jgi:hypothetical protein
MSEIAPEILAARHHFVSHLGAPRDVIQITGNPRPESALASLDVAIFAPGGPKQPAIYATVGVSAMAMPDGRHLEGIVVARPPLSAAQEEGIVRLLGSFALFLESHDKPLGPGDVIRSKDEVGAFSDMDAVLFLPPVPFVESFHAYERPDGETVEVAWVLPVYDAEADYALAHGANALMMLFAAQQVDLTELDRDEANTLVAPEDAKELARLAEEEARNRGPAKPKLEVSSEALAAFRAGTEIVVGGGDDDDDDDDEPLPPRRRSARAPEPEPMEPEPERRGPPPRVAPRGGPRGRATAMRGPRASGKRITRFELPPERRRAPEAVEPEPREESLSPEEEKRRKVEALKAQALARAAKKPSDE